MDCSPPVSSVHGNSQAGMLEWAALSSSRGSCWIKDWVSPALAGVFFYHWDTWETPYSLIFCVYNWDCVIWPHLHSPGLGVSSEREELSFSHWVMSDSLWPHGLQHTRPPCPSPSPRVCPSSCPMNQWCHPTISSSVVPFSSCLQSFPVSGSFPMSRLFTSGGQSVGASTSASVLSMNIKGWFPLGLIGLISLQSKGLSQAFSSTTIGKDQFFGTLPSLVQLSHLHTQCTFIKSPNILIPFWNELPSMCPYLEPGCPQESSPCSYTEDLP